MAAEQYVILTGRSNGISISLDQNADFEVIKFHLQQKVSNARRFFDGANARIDFRGRPLSEEETQSLLDIITEETTLEMPLADRTIRFPTSAEPPPAGQVVRHPAAPPEEVSAEDAGTAAVRDAPHLPYTEINTAFYASGLRSGQSIRYTGSVVVMGDTNPGSEIVAAGNVVVLGALNGMAHAGVEGDDRCYIAALSLMPTQMRIAHIYAELPQTPYNVRTRRQGGGPVYVYLKDGKIYIAPLTD